PFLRRRTEWFDRMEVPSVALWWVPLGHRPDVAEARLRLEFLGAHGASPYAFGLRSPEPPFVIQRASLDDPVARQLIAELDADLMATTEPGSNFFSLDAGEVTDGRGAFLIAWLDGDPVGCGGLRVLEGEWPERTAEVKRMYVRPGGRGRRIGPALLTELTALARSLGVSRLVLETADQQVAALAMYRSQGFEACACWGEYAASPLSRCFSRMLG
ncbi:MAG TPA: GNAT family N-acetyltransferase, partial [Acidimicrobiales bacterium]